MTVVEEDIFGSDFESTDEEAEKAIEQAGEAEAVYEERRTKKVSDHHTAPIVQTNA